MGNARNTFCVRYKGGGLLFYLKVQHTGVYMGQLKKNLFVYNYDFANIVAFAHIAKRKLNE